MPSIALMTTHARFPWSRQIPVRGLGRWRFTFNQIEPDCMLVAVYDEPLADFETHLPAERRLVFLTEPPGMKRYSPGFLDQFGAVTGPVEPKGHSGRWLPAPPSLPWFYGIGFSPEGPIANAHIDDLLGLSPPPKRPAVSVVISKKAILPKHRTRLAFVEALQQRLGDRLVVFGRGFREIDDKAEAILPFAYHLVLENNDIEHFWTEKTADAFLGWSMPLFSGCANLGAYMPEGSFIPIDINKPEKAMEVIAATLDSGLQTERLSLIGEARQSILTEFNLFDVLVRHAETMDGAAFAATRPRTILTNRDFSLVGRIKRILGLKALANGGK